jgi:hypothetical protein
MLEVNGLESRPGLGWVEAGSKALTKFALEYEHNGKKWCSEFFADDEDDAREKLVSMKASLVLLGEIKRTIPWNPDET